MSFKIRQPNPSLGFTAKPRKRARTSRIILHHYHHKSATPHDVHRWHLDRGWIGNGYNYAVDMDGTIWEIRGHESEGTHTANNNGDSIGIACQGRYDDQTRAMPDIQFNALVWLIKYLRGIYRDIKIIGHRDASPSACPGRYFPLAEVQRLQFRGNIMPEAQTVTLDILGSAEEIGGYIDNGATFVRLTDFAAALGFVTSWDAKRGIPVVSVADDAPGQLLTCQEDIRVLQEIVHWEARGEDTKGQILVANVVMNRLYSPHFPDSIRDVIFAPGAFTSTQRPDFNAAAPSAQTVEAVSEALNGADFSQGATFFHSLNGITPEVWHEQAVAAGRLIRLFDHGWHRFYKHA